MEWNAELPRLVPIFAEGCLICFLFSTVVCCTNVLLRGV
jgi:hypothetical protein